MKFYAIMHKPSGKFLPAGRGRGYTHDEPRHGVPPRLFATEGGAKQALRWWLKGVTYAEREHDEWNGAYSIGPSEPVPVPTRKKENMEVVSINLNLVNYQRTEK